MVRLEWPLHVVRRVAVAVAAAVVAGAALWLGVGWLQERLSTCAEGVVERGARDECVGVTDGAYAFAPDLDEVRKKIREENARVLAAADREPYVSVAYLTSFTTTADDSNSAEGVRHELQGAYLAQYRHNRGDLSATPKIRLLIANAGSRSAQWRYTVDELIARKGAPDRLVAVAGLGPSTDENLAAVRRLSENGIAMVGATMTATDIQNIDGFVRVAPTNVDEAYAAAGFLKRRGSATAVVIQDVAQGNLYASTLGTAFTEAFQDGAQHKLVAERMTYDSSVGSAWQNELRYMPGQLCLQRPQVVYFAGRGRQLTHFLDALSNRSCTEQKFTVFTGDDTTNLTAEQIAHAAETGVEVLYTGLSHPDMYRTSPQAVSAPSAKNFQPGGLLDQWFPRDPRYDGGALMGHDAVLAAAQGIQMAARWQGKVDGAAVGRMFHQMDGSQQVAGASGFISFQNNGNPRNKAVPILRLTAAGQAEFVEVSAAEGKPPEQQ
ncbi:branched-chain amino acid ABC transporter substrate-binding protein [Streptomyces subrutilus]|uniref:ABC transporter substrate-binding protein n=1 Tax=Streptomyces subrutilus TaxID=36818 RepID=A0A5P2UD64_9ACTN|nr:branched-chain amino acid ABC transporter substrate-binding protein [Streptomyces subrutilus]QEU77213.1 branched-chain amino acid ABC transporter substrate-binding protein [Streptomyces subrutilus]WSJ33811.1 branched-chain amino acid ABC transporter substrate-binding protein [Streptomyces subrutilus]GGZ45574.1 ABC transporter substrate-binding protein [Streptomyces subrutilus]